MAASLAAELKESLGIDLELIPGGGGFFEVEVDGELIFSKRSLGRFPEPGEITEILKGMK